MMHTRFLAALVFVLCALLTLVAPSVAVETPRTRAFLALLAASAPERVEMRVPDGTPNHPFRSGPRTPSRINGVGSRSVAAAPIQTSLQGNDPNMERRMIRGGSSADPAAPRTRQSPAGNETPSPPSLPAGNPAGVREPRRRRNYDVPLIECAPGDDGMDRFACPSPDRQGRYRCIDDHGLCDGFIDCPNAEDEDRMSCMFYKTMYDHLTYLHNGMHEKFKKLHENMPDEGAFGRVSRRSLAMGQRSNLMRRRHNQGSSVHRGGQ